MTSQVLKRNAVFNNPELLVLKFSRSLWFFFLSCLSLSTANAEIWTCDTKKSINTDRLYDLHSNHQIHTTEGANRVDIWVIGDTAEGTASAYCDTLVGRDENHIYSLFGYSHDFRRIFGSASCSLTTPRGVQQIADRCELVRRCSEPLSGEGAQLFDGYDFLTQKCTCDDPNYEARRYLRGGDNGCFLKEDNADKDLGNDCDAVGNPCKPSNGNKIQIERDIVGNILPFYRTYNSLNLVDFGLGKGWRHNYQRKLRISGSTITQISGTGRGEPWSKVDGIWRGEADSQIQIEELENGFRLIRANNDVEHYNHRGQLLEIVRSSGEVTTYSYNDGGLLTRVTSQYGHTLTFDYEGGRLSTVTDSLNQKYAFSYDNVGNLSFVTLPKSTKDTDIGNPRRQYHYEDSDFPNHLTGITDESGKRYATYAYDANGRATLSEHAQTTNASGQQRHTLDYNPEAPQ